MESTPTPSEPEQKTEFLFKILIVGDSSVGKTNIISKYTRNQFSENTEATLGVDFTLHPTTINSKKLTAQFWDTAGQEQFRSMSTAYYKNAHGAVIVYDITRRLTFDSILSWLKEIRNYTDQDLKMILLGNKKDLFDQINVPKEEAENFAKEHGLFFLEVSAKDNTDGSLEKAFESLFTMLLDSPMCEEQLEQQMRFNKMQQDTKGIRDEVDREVENGRDFELPPIDRGDGEKKKGCC